MNSCLYEGTTSHRRFEPVDHQFSYPLYMMWLDLAELSEVFKGRWLWSTDRPALARFRREDHLGDPRIPLDEAVRRLVSDRTGRRPTGAIRLLTHLRYFGYVFNPVSLFYCYAEDGESLDAIVAEVSNTPWNERYCYVLTSNSDTKPGKTHRFETPKEFHVSPFMGMDRSYQWTFRSPGARLSLAIRSFDTDGNPGFDASLSMRRRELSGRALASALLRYPVMTAQVVAAIYWQASRLRRKQVPVHPHPDEIGASVEHAR